MPQKRKKEQKTSSESNHEQCHKQIGALEAQVLLLQDRLEGVKKAVGRRCACCRKPCECIVCSDPCPFCEARVALFGDKDD